MWHVYWLRRDYVGYGSGKHEYPRAEVRLAGRSVANLVAGSLCGARLIDKLFNQGVNLIRGQKGQSLIEVLMAVAILGVVTVAFLSALATGSKAVILADKQTTAESLTRSELEYVKSQPFSENPWSYNVSTTGYSTDSFYPSWWDDTDPDFHKLPLEYSNYSATVTAEGYDINGDDQDDIGIWQITVQVYHSASPNPDDLVLTTTTLQVFL